MNPNQTPPIGTNPAAPHGPAPVGIVLCADDYGLAPGLGQAIRHLLSLGRLSATSCMTGSPFWPEEAAALKPFATRADIGLHLTLTDQRPLGAMPRLAPAGKLPGIMAMIRLAHSRRLASLAIRDEIRGELTRQLDRFEREFGRPPAYLDGHQHVHQLPVVRDIVIELHQTRLASNSAYLRYCTEPLGAILGRGAVTEALGIAILGLRFARRARALGIPGNRRFAGVHDFSGKRPYGELFESFIKNPEPGLLVMCHPGLADAALAAADPVTNQREEEYRYFLDDAFTTALRKNGAEIARFTKINSPRR